MATIIDALLVTLGLDASGMTAGAKEAEAAQAKIKRDAEESLEALKQQQEEAAEAFEFRLKKELSARKISKGEAKKQASDFKKQQKEELEDLKKSNKEKIELSKKDAAEKNKASQAAEQQAKKISEGISKAKNEVLGLIAGFVGFNALKNFASDITNADVALGRLAKTLDVEPKFLSAFEGAAKTFGATEEDAENILRTMTAIGEKLKKTGIVDPAHQMALEQAAQEARKNGAVVDTSSFYKQSSTSIDRAKLLNKIFSNLSSTSATYFAGKFGLGEGQARLLQVETSALQKEIEEREKIQHISQAQMNADLKRNALWDKLSDHFKGIGREISGSFAPAINYFQSLLGGALDFADNHLKATTATVTALSLALVSLSASSLVGVAEKFGLASLSAIRFVGILGNAGLVGAAGAAGYAVGTLANEGLDLLIKKLTGADATLGTLIFDLFNFKDKSDSANGLSKQGFEKEKRDKELAEDEKHPAIDSPNAVNGNNYIDLGNDEDALPGAKKDVYVAPVALSVAKAIVSKKNISSNTKKNAEDAAYQAEKKYGIPAAVTLAQFQLESSNGKHMPKGSNNPFGIKAKNGEAYVTAMTHEVINGVDRYIAQNFKKFDSLTDAFEAHAKLLATAPAYTEARRHKDDANAFADSLTGKYATDPKYGEKLKKIISQQKNVDPAISKALQPGSSIDKGLNTGSAAAVNTRGTINNTGNNSTSSTEVNVNGPINVHTQAKDSSGIAKTIGGNLQSYIYASNANRGLA